MTYETYHLIFIISAILCGIMVVVSVLLFIALKIPKVIGDLTGSTARKAIEDIRNQNESTGNKTYKSSMVNKERGKLTDKISQSGNLISNASNSLVGAMSTEKIASQQLTSEETTVLSVDNETTVLSEDILFASDETTLLSQFDNVSAFTIEYEITYIHTNEEITLGVNV